WFRSLKPACARPFPRGRVLDQPLSDRVIEEVLDHRGQRRRLGDVPVESAPGLPEPPLLPSPTSDRDSFDPLGGVLPQISDRLATPRLLDGPEQGRDRAAPAARVNDQVDVAGHEDVSPQAEGVLLARRLDGLGEPEASAFRGEKAKPLVSGEGELVRVTGLV